MPKRPQHADDAPLAHRFRTRLADEQTRQGMSDAGLAKRVTDLGVPMTAATIWKIKSSEPPRKVDLDEAQAITHAFGYEGVEDFLENQEDARLDRAAVDLTEAAVRLKANANSLLIAFHVYREAMADASNDSVVATQEQVAYTLQDTESEVVPTLALLRRLGDRSKRRKPGDEDELKTRIGDALGPAGTFDDVRYMHPSMMAQLRKIDFRPDHGASE